MPTPAKPRVGCTLDEVAVELGLSRERIRQIEAQALGKLRRAYAREGLAFDDLSCPEPATGRFELPERSRAQR